MASQTEKKLDRVTLQFNGRVSIVPRVKITSSGKKVCSFGAAANVGDNRVFYADFECWDHLADWAANLKKGSPIEVTARARTDSFQRKDGTKATKTVYTIFDLKSSRQSDVSDTDSGDELDLPF